MTPPQDIDADLVRKLASLLDETRLTEIEYAWGELRVRVARQAAPAATLQVAAPQVAAPTTAGDTASGDDPGRHPGAVRSPMVGTVYLSSQPETPPFVKLGDKVSAGQTLLIIEAMKVMNEIRAPKAGSVSRILVENGGPVEFGQVVMLVD